MSEEKRLTHLDDEGALRMVDVGEKGVTRREATAQATVRMSAETLRLIERKALPKGDVLTVAKVAGILAAKSASSLIPLTHPLPIDFADVAFEVDRDRNALRVIATVRCQGRTGVEIEAMTACSVAALTVYDMAKSAEKGIVIERIELLRKSGGKSGTWER